MSCNGGVQLARTRKEICDYLGLNSVAYAIQTHVMPLVEAGEIIVILGGYKEKMEKVISLDGNGFNHKWKIKTELRKEILKRRDDLTSEQRHNKSNKIVQSLVVQKAFLEADIILLFASYKSEVETGHIFHAAREAGKQVYYPKVLGKEMEFYLVEQEDDLLEGYRGILEPEENVEKQFRYEKVLECSESCKSEKSDDSKTVIKICVIMPGAVFDKEGNRIGYGGGYYDKYLERLEEEKFISKVHVTKIAVAFECQIVENGKIVQEFHDIKPNCIITENDIFYIENV